MLKYSQYSKLTESILCILTGSAQHSSIFAYNRAHFARIFLLGGIFTETRVAVIGIIVENRDSAAELNAVLSEYGDYIIGRMGVPYHKKNINIISVAVDAPQDVINTLGGKIGRLSGVSAKTAYANV